MLKSILAITLKVSFLLTVTTAAQAAVSPLPIIIDQCLQLPSPAKQLSQPNTELHSQQTTRIQSHQLELTLLSLFNIKDRLAYYKTFPLKPLYKEGLIQCQLRLSDMVDDTLNLPQINQLTSSLLKSGDPELSQLGIRVKRLINENKAQTFKSQLYTALASIRQGLRSKDLTLRFSGASCQLPVNRIDGSSTMDNFHQSIASYLLEQNDKSCQKLVWQAYQGRAKEKSTPALTRIANLKQHEAVKAGFKDHSSHALSSQFLSSAELVGSFLDTETALFDTPPWEIGQRLAAADKTPVKQVSSTLFIQRIYSKATKLGFKFEVVTEHIHRIWHQNRLLGELYLNTGKRSGVYRLRAPIQGVQFGQVQINIKSELSSLRDKQQLVSAMATAIAQLSRSSHYYLVNTLGETSDSYLLGQLWLTEFLSEGLLEVKQPGSREEIASKYSTQLKVFRAKVALSFYQHKDNKTYQDLAAEFNQAFGHTWTETDNYPFSFFALADLGPLYYQDIWQAALANLIFQSTKGCINQQKVLALLLINEDSLSITQGLTALLGQPVDPISLIKRIEDVSYSKDKPALSCTL
ncbi:hypothetical protein [Shewanella nanhaiensis]|uniref:Uncharacterized protein n=1 Tax=Shewanella nanhaiensis TaxID=2864872 RepID=A0ABS7E651_9GAMM|nr:hypothetical protein [Shewanella nanhaiensis]MBW8184828.1 hypothetical protein [Shewanella nanhaiensis]